MANNESQLPCRAVLAGVAATTVAAIGVAIPQRAQASDKRLVELVDEYFHPIDRYNGLNDRAEESEPRARAEYPPRPAAPHIFPGMAYPLSERTPNDIRHVWKIATGSEWPPELREKAERAQSEYYEAKRTINERYGLDLIWSEISDIVDRQLHIVDELESIAAMAPGGILATLRVAWFSVQVGAGLREKWERDDIEEMEPDQRMVASLVNDVARIVAADWPGSR